MGKSPVRWKELRVKECQGGEKLISVEVEEEGILWLSASEFISLRNLMNSISIDIDEES